MLSRFSRLLILMPKRKAQSAFYAVANGHTKGVFSTWAECQEQINGFSSAKFKKFETQEEAQAFVDSGPTWSKNAVPAKKPKVDEPAVKATTSSKRAAKTEDKFYAVAKGHSTGVFLTWPECQAAITGFKQGPKFKKFNVSVNLSVYFDWLPSTCRLAPRQRILWLAIGWATYQKLKKWSEAVRYRLILLLFTRVCCWLVYLLIDLQTVHVWTMANLQMWLQDMACSGAIMMREIRLEKSK